MPAEMAMNILAVTVRLLEQENQEARNVRDDARQGCDQRLQSFEATTDSEPPKMKDEMPAEAVSQLPGSTTSTPAAK